MQNDSVYWRLRMSLPVLGAWIEIGNVGVSNPYTGRRSLYWERGLKYHLVAKGTIDEDVASCIGSVD